MIYIKINCDDKNQMKAVEDLLDKTLRGDKGFEDGNIHFSRSAYSDVIFLIVGSDNDEMLDLELPATIFLAANLIHATFKDGTCNLSDIDTLYGINDKKKRKDFNEIMNTIGTLDYCKAELLNVSADLVPNVRER